MKSLKINLTHQPKDSLVIVNYDLKKIKAMTGISTKKALINMLLLSIDSTSIVGHTKPIPHKNKLCIQLNFYANIVKK